MNLGFMKILAEGADNLPEVTMCNREIPRCALLATGS